MTRANSGAALVEEELPMENGCVMFSDQRLWQYYCFTLLLDDRFNFIIFLIFDTDTYCITCDAHNSKFHSFEGVIAVAIAHSMLGTGEWTMYSF